MPNFCLISEREIRRELGGGRPGCVLWTWPPLARFHLGFEPRFGDFQAAKSVCRYLCMRPQLSEANVGTAGSVSETEAPLVETAEALNEHALRMEKTFACPDCTGPCEGCGRPAGGAGVELRWSAVYHSKATLFGSLFGAIAALGIGHGLFFHRAVEFSTYHSFCSHCSFKLRMKRTFAELVEKVSFALLLVGLLLFVMGVGVAPFVLFKHPTQRDVLLSALAIGGGLTAILGGWYGTTALRRRAIPAALKRISRRPFVLKSISFSD
jgi:hypothetical protein